MPAIRSKNILAVTSATTETTPATSKYFGTQHCATSRSGMYHSIEEPMKQSEIAPQLVPDFPAKDHEREAYRAPSGKKITTHQWSVYDFTLAIPKGKVATYKDVAGAVGGSPRSVGNALRNNPFAPYVPCHRVIASNYFVGGFLGEWGKEHKTGTRYNQKVELLSTEGVVFDARGYLVAKDQLMRHS